MLCEMMTWLYGACFYLQNCKLFSVEHWLPLNENFVVDGGRWSMLEEDVLQWEATMTTSTDAFTTITVAAAVQSCNLLFFLLLQLLSDHQRHAKNKRGHKEQHCEEEGAQRQRHQTTTVQQVGEGDEEDKGGDDET